MVLFGKARKSCQKKYTWSTWCFFPLSGLKIELWSLSFLPLLPCLLCHDELHPYKTVSQNKPILSQVVSCQSIVAKKKPIIFLSVFLMKTMDILENLSSNNLDKTKPNKNKTPLFHHNNNNSNMPAMRFQNHLMLTFIVATHLKQAVLPSITYFYRILSWRFQFYFIFIVFQIPMAKISAGG